MAGQPDPGHTFARVEEGFDGYVLRCRCGWESPSSRSAEVVGEAWDAHRVDVGVATS